MQISSAPPQARSELLCKHLLHLIYTVLTRLRIMDGILSSGAPWKVHGGRDVPREGSQPPKKIQLERFMKSTWSWVGKGLKCWNFMKLKGLKGNPWKFPPVRIISTLPSGGRLKSWACPSDQSSSSDHWLTSGFPRPPRGSNEAPRNPNGHARPRCPEVQLLSFVVFPAIFSTSTWLFRGFEDLRRVSLPKLALEESWLILEDVYRKWCFLGKLEYFTNFN